MLNSLKPRSQTQFGRQECSQILWEFGWESGKLTYFPITAHNFFHKVYCVITRLSIIRSTTCKYLHGTDLFCRQSACRMTSVSSIFPGRHFLWAKLGYDEKCEQGKIIRLNKMELHLKQTKQNRPSLTRRRVVRLSFWAALGILFL